MEFLANKFAVLGLGKSGLAAAYKLKELGISPFLSEKKSREAIDIAAEIDRKFEVEYGGHSSKVLDNDIIILSPGIPQNISIIKKAREKNIEVISEIEFAYRIKAKQSKIIAVTGSNGKSTTVSIIKHLLNQQEKKTILAGNIGYALSSFPIEKPGIDYIVLEVSSFQLELLKQFKADVAVLLNITPDHLNRYESFDKYAETKFKIFNRQTKHDLAVLNFDDRTIAKYLSLVKAEKLFFSLKKSQDAYLKNRKIYLKNKTYSLKKTNLKGLHNYANIMAALLSVDKIGLDDDKIKNALANFKPLEHRLEFVDKIGGVAFYNDSKATNTDSVLYGLQSFQQPVRAIMGGSDKGEDFTKLIPVLKKTVRKVYLIGETRTKMAKIFASSIDYQIFDDFEEVIRAAYLESNPGEIVLLSPACASYDMFDNFEMRGKKFKQIVGKIKDETKI